MSTTLQLRVTAAAIVAAVSMFSSQTAFAGGDLIPVAPVEKTRSTGSWTGFTVGGGLGMRKLGADIDVNSRTESRSADYDCDGPNPVGKKTRKINNPGAGAPSNASDLLFQHAWECMKQYENHPTKGNYKYYGLGHHYADYAFSEKVEADGDWSAFGTVQIGYDYQLTKRLVIGAFANVDFGSTEADFSFSHKGPTTADNHPIGQSFRTKGPKRGHMNWDPYGEVGSDVSGSIESDFSLTVGGRVGFLLSEKTLAYSLLGYTRTELSGDVNFAIQDQYASAAIKSDKFIPVNLSESFNETVHGVTVGFGGEHKLNNRWSIKAEYRYTWLGEIQKTLSKQAFDDLSMVKSNGNTWTRSVDSETTFDINPHVNSFRVLMTYKFD